MGTKTSEYPFCSRWYKYEAICRAVFPFFFEPHCLYISSAPLKIFFMSRPIRYAGTRPELVNAENLPPTSGCGIIFHFFSFAILYNVEFSPVTAIVVYSLK